MEIKKRAILLSLIISICLLIAKFAAFFFTDSNAIFSDAAESVVNVIASSFAFYSIYLTNRPKDENHPYGHGKIEFFSAFLEGVLVILAAILIIVKSSYNIVYPQAISNLVLGTIIIAVSGFINLLVGLYLKKIGRQQNSITLLADGKHLLTDTYTSIAIVVGLVAVHITNIVWLDSLSAGLIALYIGFTGYKLVRTSVAGLMDESDAAIVAKLALLLQNSREDAWIDVHNLRTQQYGPNLHIDCHITLPYYLQLTEVHQEISEIDKLINNSSVGDAELFIHADPCLPQCCNYCRVKNCAVRAEPFQREIIWTPELIVKNNKHFSNELL